jgi:amino acid transporter
MSQSFKLSLPSAIIINMNIMLGVGLFVNTISLAKMAGIMSPLIYLLVAFLMLPLVLSIAKLLKIHPGGSFYTFGKNEVGTWFGFLTAWSYFISKMASATLMIHFATLIIQNTFPALKCLPIIWVDLAILGLFSWLNMKNMRTGSKIQFSFMLLKVIPVLFIITTGLIFFDLVNIDTNIIWKSVPLSIPLIIYAFSGFEASCSLSAHIQNAEKNAPRATLTAFFLIATLSALYQLMFYGMIGTELGNLNHYFEIFPAIINKLFIASSSFGPKLQAVLQLAIAISSFGGSYGIMFSNCWNLHTLAKENHIIGSKLIAKLNQHNVPVYCILAEAVIGVTYLLATNGNNIPLQQIGAFGCTLAYSLCVIALLANAWRQPDKKNLILPILGLLSCIFLLASCINGFLQNGTYSPLALFGFLIFGIIMFLSKKS